MINIVEADLDNPDHANGILKIIKCYAGEPGGGSQQLPQETQSHLIGRLKTQSNRLVLLALEDDLPVGLAVCFRAFSTFMAKPLINIHDLAVLPEFRGKGIGGKLIAHVTSLAETEDCCRVTLEVYSNNQSARRLYQRCGFKDSNEPDQQVIFLSCPLNQ